ncbi:MAG: ATP-binding protein [Myxococcota bacterium]|nr:ATP-binding protein [Myxococcota bacterium]
MFRLLLGLGVMVLSVLAVAERPWVLLTTKQLFYAAAGAFLVMGVSAAVVGQLGQRLWFIGIQLLLDTALVTALVGLTDGPHSAFFSLYFMNIMGAAFLLPRWGALALAGVDSVALIVCTLAGEWGVFRLDWQVGGVPLYTEILLRVFAMVLVGVLSAQLATKWREARKALAEHVQLSEGLRERHEVVLDQVATGILATDDHGIIQMVNPAVVRLFGPVEGRHLSEVLPKGADSWQQMLGIGDDAAFLLCTRSNLETGGEMVLIEDLTEARQMQTTLERERRLAMVGRLAAALAHEIRNPLASLSGAVQLMRDEKPGPLQEIVLREVTRLNDLVEEFLDTARPLNVNIRTTDVEEVVHEVVGAFTKDPRYREEIEVEINVGELSPVQLDRDRLHQVLWNLLLNAAQAPEVGLISLAARADLEELVLSVSDDGPGIPVELRSRIFDPFYTTRSGGTGLGLAIVEQVVRAHGGSVHVTDSDAGGTTFLLNFPQQPVKDEEKSVGQ